MGNVTQGTRVADAYDDVVVLRWPDEIGQRERLAAEGRARLLVVAPVLPPPEVWDPLEDWMREPVDPVEMYVRRERLRRRLASRASATLDDDGLVRRGARWVALSPREARLVRPLLARQGCPVGRRDLVAAVWPETGVDDHRALDTFVRRARTRLRPLGLVIHNVRGVGFLLQAEELA